MIYFLFYFILIMSRSSLKVSCIPVPFFPTVRNEHRRGGCMCRVTGSWILCREDWCISYSRVLQVIRILVRDEWGRGKSDQPASQCISHFSWRTPALRTHLRLFQSGAHVLHFRLFLSYNYLQYVIFHYRSYITRPRPWLYQYN